MVGELSNKKINITQLTKQTIDKMNLKTIETVEQLRQEIINDSDFCINIVKYLRTTEFNTTQFWKQFPEVVHNSIGWMKVSKEQPTCPQLTLHFLEDYSHWYFQNTKVDTQEEINNWIENECGLSLSWLKLIKQIWD